MKPKRYSEGFKKRMVQRMSGASGLSARVRVEAADGQPGSVLSLGSAVMPLVPSCSTVRASECPSAGAPPAHGALVTGPATRTSAEPDRPLAGGLRRSAYDYSVGPLQRTGGGL